MKATLLLMACFGGMVAAYGQDGGPAVSTSRSVRQKISTKSLYTPTTNNAAKNSTAVNASNGDFKKMQAIQFVQSQAEFLPSSQTALDELVAFMRDKPTVEIELGGHTDNQGDFDQNVALSKKRVDLVKSYLVKNGIDAKRITTRGFGPTRPVASNRTEETRKLNRRVEMTITKQ